MHTDSQVSILVVTHNHGQYLKKLLKSLEDFKYKNVYFCDTASTDDTVEILKKSSFKNQILFKNELEGFAKNNNDLIRHFQLDSEYYLLLNPDVFFTEDFLSILLQKFKQNPSAGIAAPLVYYPDGNLQVTWKRFPSLFSVILKRLGIRKTTDEKQSKASEIDWALGACLLISQKLLKNDGRLLDERYRLYCEDIDICFESKTRGMEIIGVEETFIYHHLNELSAKKIWSKYNFWNLQSIFKFVIKWNFKYLFRNV